MHKCRVYMYMCSLKFVFNIYSFLRVRETEHERARGRGSGRHRIRSRLQAPSCQQGAWRASRTHRPRDHDLSWSWTLTRQSHPGAPVCSCVSHNEGVCSGRNIVSFALLLLVKDPSLEYFGREHENGSDGVPDSRGFSSTLTDLRGSLSNRWGSQALGVWTSCVTQPFLSPRCGGWPHMLFEGHLQFLAHVKSAQFLLWHILLCVELQASISVPSLWKSSVNKKFSSSLWC